MTSTKQLFLIITIFSLISFSNGTFAQENGKLLIETIDNEIKNIETICSKSDSLCTEGFSHGYSKFYKKLLGFIKIRYGKGTTFKTTTYYNFYAFHHNYNSYLIKKNKSHHFIENYYFIDSSLVKYESIDFWTFKNGSTDILNHRIVIYLDHKKIIDKQMEINDKYLFTNNKFEQILKYSDELHKELEE